MGGWEILLYVVVSLGLISLFALGRGGRILGWWRRRHPKKIKLRPEVVEPRTLLRPPTLRPSADLPSYTRLSTASSTVLRYLAEVAGPGQAGVAADQIMRACGLPRSAQAHLALSLKDAMAEGLVVNTAAKGDQYRYALTRDGLKVAIQSDKISR